MQNLFSSTNFGRFSLLNNFYNGTRFNLLLTKNSSFFFFFRFFLFPLKKLLSKKQPMYLLNNSLSNSFFFSLFAKIPFLLNSNFFGNGLFSNQFFSKKNTLLLENFNMIFFKSATKLNSLKNYSTNVSFVSLIPLTNDLKYKELSSLNNFSLGLHVQKTSFFHLLFPLLTDSSFLSLSLFYYYLFFTLRNEYNFSSSNYRKLRFTYNKAIPKKQQRHYILSMKSWFFLRFFFSFFLLRSDILKTKSIFLNVYKKSNTIKRLFFKKKYFKTTLFYKFAKAKYAFYVKKHRPYFRFKRKLKFFKKKIFLFKKYGFGTEKKQVFSKRLFNWKPPKKQRFFKTATAQPIIKNERGAIRFAAVNFKF
jgi:hypothetical protein